jgi:hypothetical protein
MKKLCLLVAVFIAIVSCSKKDKCYTCHYTTVEIRNGDTTQNSASSKEYCNVTEDDIAKEEKNLNRTIVNTAFTVTYTCKCNPQ